MLGAAAHTQSTGWVRNPGPRQVPGAETWWLGADPALALTEHTAPNEIQDEQTDASSPHALQGRRQPLGGPGPKIQAWDGITESADLG